MLDPEAVRFLEQLRDTPPIWSRSIADNRRDVGPLPGPAPQVGAVEDLEIPLRGRALRARLYQAAEQNWASTAAPLTLFFHGGGWVMGSIDSHDHLARGLCGACGGRVLSVDYRLAPEHRFPAAVDDAYEATVWASDQLAGGAPLIVAGDSAGGNLAAVTAHMARDRGGPPLAVQILIYPITDCRFDTPSYQQHGEGLNLTRRDMQYFWEQYCPNLPRRLDPEASPLQMHDLSRLPPAILVLAGYDPLNWEGRVYGERLQRAGTPVVEIDCPGMVHGFMRRQNGFAKAREVAGEIGRAVRAELSGST